MSGIRATGAANVALGFAAPAPAVVPGFVTLPHANKRYLAGTYLLAHAAPPIPVDTRCH